MTPNSEPTPKARLKFNTILEEGSGYIYTNFQLHWTYREAAVAARNSKNNFFCPAGHAWNFPIKLFIDTDDLTWSIQTYESKNNLPPLALIILLYREKEVTMSELKEKLKAKLIKKFGNGETKAKKIYLRILEDQSLLIES